MKIMKDKLMIAALSCALCLPAFGQSKEEEKTFINENMEFAVNQYHLMLQTPPQGKEGKGVMPHSMRKDGTVAKGSIYLWTSGFFPGSLWYLSDYTGNREMKDAALEYTQKMEPVKTFTDNHDIGFMMYCSYGNANRFAPKAEYNDILIESAKSLCTRFSPVTGVIKSWNSWRSWNDETRFEYPVIIDNMMNLELLFAASRISGDESYKNVAVSHALKTSKYHMREDGSFYHIAMYDPKTGDFIKGETSQGYSDNSAWSRGQGWAIYGFTVVYRETGDKRFLATAEKAADYYINHPNLPADKVAWWDFNAHQEGFTPGIRSNARKLTANYRDASAAALVASALFELSGYVKGKKSELYLKTAKQILHSLGSEKYRAKLGENANFIIMHCTGAIPQNSEIDVPLTYADYYFIEALHRYNKILNDEPLF